MKRKLLLFFVMLFVSIGAWANITTGSTTWCQYNSYADTENVLTIYVDDPGELATAIASLDFTDVKILHISARNREASLLELSSEDIAALSSVNVETIEMMRAYVSPFTFTNSNLKRVILPYNWTRAEVKAFGQANSTSANFECCISTNDQDKYDNREGDVTLIAYLNKANTLKDAIMRTWNDTHGYAPLGNQVYQGGGDCTRVRELIVMGNFCARDISSKGDYDENGHYKINGIADENNPTWNKNTAGENLYAVPENGNNGALAACGQLYIIDLKDGYVPDEYATDIVVGYNGIGNSNLREVWMPEDSRFKTVPADYLNVNGSVRQICIPGNIEYIKTRAFASASGTGRMCYIWTTGSDPNGKYDNGAAFVNGEETTMKYMNNTAEGNVAMTESDYNQFQYGTFTLPANLRLIERWAFAGSDRVSDVYVLNATAPECHVDAFNCVMYVGNNALQTQYIKDGIVTREAYRNDASGTEYKYVSILHYPRETTDPDIQRYTDPTREYSIATGERDGNGSTIYYPNHSEMTYAYYQGSYGYLWKGWDDSRNLYDQSLKIGYGEGLPSTEPSHKSDNPGAQSTANGRWVANEVNLPKADRSFYDVTTGGNNQFNEVTAPDGLTPYYENSYNGILLYPQAKTETSKYVYVRDDNGDYVKDPTDACEEIFRNYTGSADDKLERYSRKQVLQTDNEGNLVYEQCSNGTYVENYSMVEDENGDFIHDIEVEENAEGDYVKDYTFTEDNENGTYYHPLVATAAPADTWNTSSYNPTDYYWGAATFTQDNNGEWVKFWGETYRTAENVQAHEVDAFNAAAADPANHYSKTVTGYTQCTSADDINNHSSDLYKVGEKYVLYVEGAADYIANVNDTKYTKSYSNTYRAYNANTDAGEQRYDVEDNGYRDYNASTDEGKQRYTKTYDGTYRPVASTDAADEQRYCTVGVDYVSDTDITYNVYNDYRGWHQFILNGRAYMSIVPMEPLRSFISDNDWWTICEPYDLRYSDMIKFFGYDRTGFDKKIPYLSKLMYVVRDVENQQITLMFSKNLMEYKEQFVEADGTLTGKEQFVETNGKSSGRVHGFVDDETKWTANELAQDPVILHAGVPYLIRPNLMFEDGKAQRQFDIYKSSNEDLYNRLKYSEDLDGDTQMEFVHNGIYTVPAFVVGYNSAAVSESTIASGVKEIEMKDGTKFTYRDSEHGGKKLKYKGKDVDYKISSDYTYSFVGTFYKSVIPQYSYFLGWDSNANRATFWYSAQQDKTGWNWNNETGIICPNFVNLSAEQQKIHKATKVEDPARWTLVTQAGASLLGSDDFPTASSAKSYDMESDGISMVGDSEVTGIEEIVPATTESETISVYNVNGVFMGNSVEGLAKGIYIVNGKKYVVK